VSQFALKKLKIEIKYLNNYDQRALNAGFLKKELYWNLFRKNDFEFGAVLQGVSNCRIISTKVLYAMLDERSLSYPKQMPFPWLRQPTRILFSYP
jgi:hypothetical protein